MKKFFGLFALLAAVGGAVMFWRKRKDDDEFLDEELE
ncbi:MAG: LPXTG cell wall anchor domain-containing protein [Tepidiformaceae bacterium]